MNNHLAFIILAFYFGLVVTGTAQDFSNTFPQGPGQGLNYMDSYHPSYYPSYDTYYNPSYYPSDYPSACWTYPFVPVKYAVQAAKERLWVNTYMNPNSVHWQVQEAKERLWTVKNTCYGCWSDYGWMERGRSWESRY